MRRDRRRLRRGDGRRRRLVDLVRRCRRRRVWGCRRDDLRLREAGRLYAAEGSDCAPADGSRHPGASETPYDGTDQDCDDHDLEDVDGDGDDALVVGGGDCDDADPERASTRTESWSDDGVDNDCDGDARDPLSWDAGDAAARIDGSDAGMELGRRLAVWDEGACLFATAPYAEENRGRVFAEPYGPGVRTAGTRGGAVTGSEPYAFLTGLDADDAGILVLGSLTDDGGRGRVWIVDATEMCAGTEVDLAGLAATISGTDADDLLGAQARWLPDLDGDGVRELAVVAPGHDGAVADEGAVALFHGAGTDLGALRLGDADVVVTGGHLSAAMDDVVYADDRDEAWLLFTRVNAGPGGVSLSRVPVAGLASGAVDDLADGGVATEGTWLTATVVGDVTSDGSDEIVVGAAGWGVWPVQEISGVLNEGDAPTRLDADDGDEWLTGFVPIGDVDGGGRDDLLLLADDWPTGTSRGRLGVLPGEELLWGQLSTLEEQRLRATGAELGDTFGYRAVPVGDFDGDGAPELAVSAPGADPTGAAAGAVYLLPLP